jgi:hypothetical protein
MNEINTPTLYDLTNDRSEQYDIAFQHPKIVKKISKIADSIRLILGDQLSGIKGKEVRPVGRIEN